MYDEYEDVGGVRLPMEWSFFAPGSGAMTLARFADATVGEHDPAWLEPPLLIRMQTRTPEEKAAADAVLQEKYPHLPGAYQLATGSMVGVPITIAIAEGGLRLSFGGQPPDFLGEPDEEGRLFLLSNPQIYLRVTPDGEGGHDMVVFAFGDEFGRLERVEAGD